MKVETAVYNIAIWFDNNYMKLTAEKFHLLILVKMKSNSLSV